MASTRNKHRGSSFQGFLKEEGLEAEVQAHAIRRMLARQLARKMKSEKLTKTEMASRLETSRARLDVLLDPDDPTNVGIATLAKAAEVLGKRLHLELRRA
jgi:antitoxin HicB